MADSCALARQRLVKRVAELRPASRVEKVTHAIKSGFLGQLVTPLKAVGGNAINGLRMLATHPVEAGVDYLVSLGRSARDGHFSLSPDQYRQVRLSLDADGFGKIVKGFGRGAEPFREAVSVARATPSGANPWQSVKSTVQTFAKELNLRLDAQGVNRTLEYEPITYKNPTTNAIMQGVMGIMEAVDRPYWAAMHDFSMHVQSKVMGAARAAAEGGDLKTLAAEYFEKPTDEMSLRATEYANYATFKNKNILSRLANGLKNIAKREAQLPVKDTKGFDKAQRMTRRVVGSAAQYGIETNLPFTGVPSSIAGHSLSLSTGPLSLAELLVNRNPAHTARIVANSAIGTSLIAAGYALTREGRLAGAAPTDANERALWDAEGKQAWSVKIGNKWIDARFAVPVAAPLYAGYGLAKSKADNVADKAISSVASTAQMVTQQTYLTNVRAAIDALSAPEKKGARFAASQVPVPALVGQAARAIDPIERAPEGLLGQLAVKFPWLSKTQPPRVDAMGHVATRTPLERASELLSPARIKEATESPITREFERVGADMVMPGKSVTIRGEKVTRTGHEQAMFLQAMGPEVESYLLKVMELPEYQEASIDVQKEILEKVAEKVRTQRSRENAAGLLKAGTDSGKPRKVSAAGQKLLDHGLTTVFDYDGKGMIRGGRLVPKHQSEVA